MKKRTTSKKQLTIEYAPILNIYNQALHYVEHLITFEITDLKSKALVMKHDRHISLYQTIKIKTHKSYEIK